MNSLPNRYSNVSREKAHGATYTPAALAEFVASQVAATVAAHPKDSVRILDPAVGDGVLLASMVRALKDRGFAQLSVTGFDTNHVALNQAKARFDRELPGISVDLQNRDFLDVVGSLSPTPDFLDEQSFVEKFDAIIANPPYVRTQVLGAARARQLALRYDLTGRVDLYYAFLIAISRVLRSQGVLGIIISNRFMTTRSGQSVRKAIVELYELLHVWDLGDTKLFDAAVLPAVLLARNGLERKRRTPPRFTSIYETTKQPGGRSRNAIEALNHSGIIETDDGRCFDVVHGVLDTSGHEAGVWRAATAEKEKWLEAVRGRTFARFGDIGKIRVGVKTTADNVFIREDWRTVSDDMRPEVLQNLVTHHVARRYRPLDTGTREILYTHTVRNGRRSAIDLHRYPRTRAYLEAHREQLQSRSYVISAGRQWYEIWVPQDPAKWSRPKLVFPDISPEPVFWIDLTGSVVNGDCYWLVLEPGQDPDLLWLALAVGNSDFATEFYDHKFNNRLYAGRRRFITQYVTEFPIPDPSLPSSQKIISKVKSIYDQTPSESADGLAREVNELVHKAFDLPLPEVAR